MSNEPISLSNSKVLITDDKPENLDLLSGILERENYQVSFALNGEECIRVANLDLPDIILLDVMMPGIDGFETCRRLKSMTDTRHIPVIFVTGKTEVNDIVEAFAIGAVDYIVKPYRQEEVLARVQTHLQLKKLFHIRDDLITQLRDQNNKLEEVAALREEKLEQTEQFAGLGEMVSELTHEMSTPLGICTTAVSTLNEMNKKVLRDVSEGKLSKSALESYLNAASDNFKSTSSNLDYATHLLTSFKQVATDQFQGDVTKLNLKHYLESVLYILQPKLKRTPHEVNLNCGGEIMMEIPAGALSQIVINLVNNAIIHAFEPGLKGKVNINVSSPSPERVEIAFEDNGKGMDPERASKVFEKYYTTRGNCGGSGLGMYIVKKAVETSLQGSITLSSELGKGTTFTLHLPKQVEQ